MVMVFDLQEAMKEVQGGIESNPFLFSFLFLSFLVLLVYRIFTGGPKLNLPPSPPKLPIIGNIHQLGKLPHRSLRALAEKYGPVMLFHFGGNPTLVISSAEAAREMMKTHDIVFANRPITTASKILFYGNMDFAFAPYGEHWRQAKKICVLELLSHKRVESFQFIREEEGAVLIDKLRSACAADIPVNLSEMLIAASSNIISRCALGRKVDEDGGRSEYGDWTRKFMKQFTAISFGDMFRSLEWLDNLTGLIPQMKATAAALDAMLDQVVDEHKRSGPEGDQIAKTDFVDILLHVQKSGILGFPLAQHTIKGILLDMFLGGTETSATIIEWSMAELVKNPNIMKKAQEEVRRLVRKGGLKVGRDDIDKMNYLKCVVKEALRLHPPTALIPPRETTARVKFGNYHIPAKTTVLVNAFAIHTDPKVWDRAEEFLPERFENKIIDFQDQDFNFLPFGGGRRACPGITFGMSTVTFLVANLLYWFDWRLPYDRALEDLDMSEVFGLSVSKKVPLCLIPTLPSC